MVTIITGTTKKPIASESLKSFFKLHTELEGYLYIGYPIIGTVDGAYPIDGLWISPNKGLVVFNLVEGRDIENYQDEQDDCANKIEAKWTIVNKKDTIFKYIFWERLDSLPIPECCFHFIWC